MTKMRRKESLKKKKKKEKKSRLLNAQIKKEKMECAKKNKLEKKAYS